MSKNQWRYGPPPEIGWWPASASNDKKLIRWWNGEYWSLPASKRDSANKAALYAECQSGIPNCMMKWTDRWWEKNA